MLPSNDIVEDVLNKATGKKFGKTEEGAIWLDAEKTSVYRFYQFWLNVDDASVEDYLKIFTELDKPEIEKVMDEFNSNKPGRIAQKTLAHEVTKIVHGQARAKSVAKVTSVLFGNNDAKELDGDDIELLSKEIPVVQASSGLVQVLVEAGLASSNTEASRFIAEGAVSINGIRADSTEVNFETGNNLLKRGKNGFALVKSSR